MYNRKLVTYTGSKFVRLQTYVPIFVLYYSFVSGGYFLLFYGVVWNFIWRETLQWIQKHGPNFKGNESGGKKTKVRGK